MNKLYRVNSIVVGALFILTMIAGMIDAYFVVPILNSSLIIIQNMTNLLYIGVFSVFFMSIGVVVISTTLFPIVRKQSETIAITYVSFRIIECLLLTVGAIVYLFLLLDSKAIFNNTVLSENYNSTLPLLISKIKVDSYQLGMIILGIGSILLNISFYISKIIPRWLSIWGIIGYTLLLLSAIFALLGIINTTDGFGALLYIPGGLWEFIVFPVWLFINGFRIETK